MLFNLQGAHRPQRRAFILPQLISFVKHFFQVFSNFFALSFAGFYRVKRRPHGQPNYVTTLVFLCQVLFSGFFKSFSYFSGKTEGGVAALTDSLSRISLQESFVKRFFQVFQTDFQAPDPSDPSLDFLKRLSPRAFQGPAPEALAYNSKIPAPCQHLFSSFFTSFFIPQYLLHFLTRFHKICRLPVFCRQPFL